MTINMRIAQREWHETRAMMMDDTPMDIERIGQLVRRRAERISMQHVLVMQMGPLMPVTGSETDRGAA